VSEEQTWSSEDTRLFSFKVFFGAGSPPPFCLTFLLPALTAAALSEAERIVFATEGLFLAHDFPSTAESGINAVRSVFGYGYKAL
jgi:hypothetical protein